MEVHEVSSSSHPPPPQTCMCILYEQTACSSIPHSFCACLRILPHCCCFMCSPCCATLSARYRTSSGSSSSATCSRSLSTTRSCQWTYRSGTRCGVCGALRGVTAAMSATAVLFAVQQSTKEQVSTPGRVLLSGVAVADCQQHQPLIL